MCANCKQTYFGFRHTDNDHRYNNPVVAVNHPMMFARIKASVITEPTRFFRRGLFTSPTPPVTSAPIYAWQAQYMRAAISNAHKTIPESGQHPIRQAPARGGLGSWAGGHIPGAAHVPDLVVWPQASPSRTSPPLATEPIASGPPAGTGTSVDVSSGGTGAFG
jgi:hypothetical protein